MRSEIKLIRLQRLQTRSQDCPGTEQDFKTPPEQQGNDASNANGGVTGTSVLNCSIDGMSVRRQLRSSNRDEPKRKMPPLK